MSLGLGIGAVASSNLVTDSIVETIAVRPQVAPQLDLRVEKTLSARYRLAGDLAVSRSTVEAHGPSSSSEITSLTLWSPGIGLVAAATSWLGAEARLGALIYDPGATEGTLFADGAPVTPVLGLGLRAERALSGTLTGALHIRYDVHRFTTDALKARGFTGETVVHRIAFGITLYRRMSRAPAAN